MLLGLAVTISMADRYKILHTLSELFPLEKWLFQAVKFSYQANQWMRERNYHEGFANYDNALQMWLANINNTELYCYIDIGRIHSTIVYKLKDQSMTMKQADLSIMYYQLAIENTAINDYELIHIYNELSYIFRYKIKITNNVKDSLMMIKYEELHLQSLLLHYPADDIKVGRCLDNLADIYKSMSDYDTALLNYDRSLEIYLL